MLAELVWHSPRLFPLLLLLAAAIMAAVQWLYPPQARRLPRRWGWSLAGLRMAALLALAGSILKPATIRPKTPGESGAILILVDHSTGMGAKDMLQSPDELVAWADALQLLPTKARTNIPARLEEEVEQMRSLAEDVVRAQSELDYTQVSGRESAAAENRLKEASDQLKLSINQIADHLTVIPQMAKLGKRFANLESSSTRPSRDAWSRDIRSLAREAEELLEKYQGDADKELYQSDPQVRRICDELSGLSRLQRVEKVLTQPDAGLLDRLGEEMPIFGFALGDEIAPLMLRRDGQSARRLPLEPEGDGGNLITAVRQSLDRLGSQPVRAIVLFSDGRQVNEEPIIVPETPTSGVPVFAVPAAMGEGNETKEDIPWGNEALLRHLADASGGKLIRLDKLEQLAKNLNRAYAGRSQFAEYSLWDSPYLFFFVLACFTAEWALRKKFGLA